MNVTEVAQCVAPSFRIQNICFLKHFKAKYRWDAKQASVIKVDHYSLLKLSITFVFLQNRRILIKVNSVFKTTSILPVTPLRVYK